MKTINRPHHSVQDELFDGEHLSWWYVDLAPQALAMLENGFEGVFHRLLSKLPVDKLAASFSENMGRPAKELYSMIGLMVIAEYRNLTVDETASVYCYDASVQYALHLPRNKQYLCPRTVDNYRALFRENEIAQEVFLVVTTALVDELDLNIKAQRLDSTHVLSNMAKLTRQQQLSVGLKRCLVQIKKHCPEEYDRLDEVLRRRYEPAETRLFGGGIPAAKRGQTREEILGQIGQDMASVIVGFSEHEKISGFQSYAAVKRLFDEHYALPTKKGGKHTLRPKSRDKDGGSGGTLQNTSDEDAGYDGHKGAGYQAQIAQSLPPVDEAGEQEGPGLITGLLPESARESDSAAVDKVLNQQEWAGLKGESLLVDTAYGSDANVLACEERAVELIGPVNGAPVRVKNSKHGSSRKEKARKERLKKRREAEQTDEWKAKYAKRSGIEGLNRALDLTCGFKHLRVRGMKAVGVALFLKGTGWNINAAAQILWNRARKAAELLLNNFQMSLFYQR